MGLKSLAIFLKNKTMFVSNLGSITTLDGSALKIGIVQARFNDDITNALAAAFARKQIATKEDADRLAQAFDTTDAQLRTT